MEYTNYDNVCVSWCTLIRRPADGDLKNPVEALVLLLQILLVLEKRLIAHECDLQFWFVFSLMRLLLQITTLWSSPAAFEYPRRTFMNDPVDSAVMQ